jgi:hypothetical protein
MGPEPQVAARGGKNMSGRHSGNPPDRVQREGDERARLERALDEALANTFPASDPVSIEQPVPQS